MGNSSVVAHALNTVGYTDMMGHEATLNMLIDKNAIEPWDAMKLVEDNLKRQSALASKTPLKKIAVGDAMHFFTERSASKRQKRRERAAGGACCVTLAGITGGSRGSDSSPRSDEMEHLESIFEQHREQNTMCGKDAESLSCRSAEEKKVAMEKCKQEGYGGFVVWRNKAYFKKQSVIACRRGLKSDRDATTYLNLACSHGKEWEDHPEMNTLKGRVAREEICDPTNQQDVANAKQICKARGFGAFVIYRKKALFKKEMVQECREHLVDDREAITYLNQGPKVTQWTPTWLAGDQGIDKDTFVKYCNELLDARKVIVTPQQRLQLYEIFDSIDLDMSGFLSVGEWAGGLSVFLDGKPEQCTRAVFSALDVDDSGALSKDELREYLTPFVKVMSPPSADALRPILVKKVTDDVFAEIDTSKDGDISVDEFIQWTMQNGENGSIVKRLANLIDSDVMEGYRLSERGQRAGAGQSQMSGDSGNPYGQSPPGGGPDGAQYQQQQQQSGQFQQGGPCQQDQFNQGPWSRSAYGMPPGQQPSQQQQWSLQSRGGSPGGSSMGTQNWPGPPGGTVPMQSKGLLLPPNGSMASNSRGGGQSPWNSQMGQQQSQQGFGQEQSRGQMPPTSQNGSPSSWFGSVTAVVMGSVSGPPSPSMPSDSRQGQQSREASLMNGPGVFGPGGPTGGLQAPGTEPRLHDGGPPGGWMPPPPGGWPERDNHVPAGVWPTSGGSSPTQVQLNFDVSSPPKSSSPYRSSPGSPAMPQDGSPYSIGRSHREVPPPPHPPTRSADSYPY